MDIERKKKVINIYAFALKLLVAGVVLTVAGKLFVGGKAGFYMVCFGIACVPCFWVLNVYCSFAIGFFKCPRCGERFFQYRLWRAGGVKKQLSRCYTCGLNIEKIKD